MTVATARLLKAHDMVNEPTRTRVRLADLTKRAEPAASDRFERLNLIHCVSSQSPGSHVAALQKSDELQAAITSLNTVAADLRSHRDRILEQGQTESIKLGIAIAERLLRRTLATRPEMVLDLVKTTLSWVVGTETIRVRLHPSDCDIVQSHSDDLHRGCSANIQFVRDETMSRGDSFVETAQGVVDGRVETMLERIAEELLDD